MKNLKNIFKIFAVLCVGAMFFSSCKQSVQTNESEKVAYLQIVDQNLARADLPPDSTIVYSPKYVLSDFNEYTLTAEKKYYSYNMGNNTYEDPIELGVFDSYNDLVTSYIVIPSLATWKFTLEAKKDDTIFVATKEIQVTSGANSIFFELKPQQFDENGTGVINFVLTIENVSSIVTVGYDYEKDEYTYLFDCPYQIKARLDDGDAKNITDTLEWFAPENPATMAPYTKEEYFGTTIGSSTKSVSFTFTYADSEVSVGDHIIIVDYYKDSIKLKTKAISLVVGKDKTTTNADSLNSNNELKIDEVSITQALTSSQHSIIFNKNGGTFSVEPETTTFSSRDTEPTSLPAASTISRAGYTFDGWFTEAVGGQEITEIPVGTQEDVNVYAHWSLITYNITYYCNSPYYSGMPMIYPNSYNIESLSTLPEPTVLEGYEFKGWYTDSNFAPATKVSNSLYGQTGDLVLFGKFGPVTFKIFYYDYLDADITGLPEEFIPNEQVTLPSISRTGYDFNGWYTNRSYTTQVTEISIGTTENKILYAKWSPTVYTISYYDEDTLLSTDSYTIENRPSLYNPPASIGERFIGWYTQDGSNSTWDPAASCTEIPTNYTGDINLYGRWETLHFIIYELNGGAIPYGSVTNFTQLDSVTLPTPTKTNNLFVGWYKTEDCLDGTEITEFSNKNEDVYVWAKWKTLVPWTVKTNDTYKFTNTSENVWSSDNQNKNSTTATTTWEIILEQSATVNIPWTVDSEGSYDKLTVIIDNITEVNAVSGNNQSGTITKLLEAGTHTLTAKYSKDTSQSDFTDTATITLNPVNYD